MTLIKSNDRSLPAPTASPVFVALIPIMGVVFIAFIVIGLALPVLPLHVHEGLGFGTFTVGLVTGSQFAASLLSRVCSGRTCDTHGAKYAVLFGLAAASASGVLYLISVRVAQTPEISVTILLLGRGVLGAAESFIITGATVWGLRRAGAQNAGKVIAWMGTAMFAAFAGGAPVGVAMYKAAGFAAIAVATAMAPLVTLGLVALLRPIAPQRAESAGIVSVFRKVWLPGLGAALSSIGFGVILSFASLLFATRGWTPLWLAFTSYAVALIAARLILGHLPDRIGGARVALICVLIEAIGLTLIGVAPTAIIAALGAALTGFGYALVFPGLGVEAVRRAPPERRGLAMGAYTACLDLALGISGPMLGLIGHRAGLSAAFVISGLLVLCAAPIALRLQQN
ncbi:MAG: arabinose transporter [Methylobacteriaceae bacterium]|nr:arabinose transporter [Methylobacteriaceae bacterium]